MATLSLNLQEDVLLALTNLAKETGRSRSSYANEAIAKFLQEAVEDAEDYKVGEQAWKEFVANDEHGIPAEDVFKKIGL